MRRPIKMDAGLRRRPKTNALFAPKARARHGAAPENGRAFRFTDPRRAGTLARIRLTRHKPDSLPINQKSRRLSRRPSSYTIPM